jgi:hypothetical protein
LTSADLASTETDLPRQHFSFAERAEHASKWAARRDRCQLLSQAPRLNITSNRKSSTRPKPCLDASCSDRLYCAPRNTAVTQCSRAFLSAPKRG